VRVMGVRRVFDGGVVALDGIELGVPPGEFLAILGPSGCGKSTLLRLIAALDEPQAGTIAVGDDASGRRSDLAYVFQDAHLLPWRTVVDNVALPLELARVRRTDRLAAAREAIARVGLGDAAGRYPNQLSGGMRMRVSLARALVTRPRLLLLDEPFAALDEITRQHLDEQLRELWRGTGMTVVFVTHSTSEAVFLAERAVVMTRRPGLVIADHRIDLPVERPAALRGSDAFARHTRVLYEALAQGGA
jgi:NitT/TauT family transport system ATP-binding protein